VRDLAKKTKPKFDPTDTHNLAVFIANSLSDQHHIGLDPAYLTQAIERYMKEYMNRYFIVLYQP